jgi:hypothetical protein
MDYIGDAGGLSDAFMVILGLISYFYEAQWIRYDNVTKYMKEKSQ